MCKAKDCARANEDVVVMRNRHTENKDADDVEEDNSPQRLADSFGDSLSRIRSLTKSNTHDLSTSIGKAGLHHACPETQKAASWALDEILAESAKIGPIREVNALARGLAAEGNDETGENQRDDDKKLDCREPEFNFAEKGNMENLRGLTACSKEEKRNTMDDLH